MTVELKELFKDLKKNKWNLKENEVHLVATFAMMLNEKKSAYCPWGKYVRIFRDYGFRIETGNDGFWRISR